MSRPVGVLMRGMGTVGKPAVEGVPAPEGVYNNPLSAGELAQQEYECEVEAQLKAFGEDVVKMMPGFIAHAVVQNKELAFHTSPEHLFQVIEFLKLHSNCQFDQVTDVCGVDYPEREARFEVVYNLLSVKHNARIRVKTFVDETTPVPSIVSIHNGAIWFERETWDMYGIHFAENPDLRRILTDYGFEGYPMRKDFPLSGYVEVRYDDEKKMVVQEPLELSQEYRHYDARSPWEQFPSSQDAKQIE